MLEKAKVRFETIKGSVVAGVSRTGTRITEGARSARGILRFGRPMPSQGGQELPGSPAVDKARMMARRIHAPTPSGTPSLRWLSYAGAALISLVLLQCATWLFSLYDTSPVLGMLGVVGVASVTVFTIAAIRSEIVAVDRLKTGVSFQEAFDSDQDPAHKIRRLHEWLDDSGVTPDLIQEIHLRIEHAEDADTAVTVVEERVLRSFDRKALGTIRDGVSHTFGLIALSPTAVTDTLLFAWRALRLVRDVAQVYGLRPSYSGAFWLLRQIISDAAVIAAADLAADAVATLLGDKVAAKLSSPLAEGSVAAYRMARFGLLTIQRCRPIPFRETDQLGLYAVLRGQSRG